MKKLKKFFFNVTILIFICSTSYSSNNIEIIAKVGSEIITSFELENKIRTTLFLSGEKLSQKNIDNIKSISLNYLINYKLKKEEIRKFKLRKEMVDVRLNNHLNNIALKLSINKREIKKNFLTNGIDYDQYLDEISTEFLWQSLIYKIYFKNVNLNENKIIEELNKTVKNQESITEYRLAEIEINYSEDFDLKVIEDHINNFGFEKAAAKYSISNSAINGGDIGWINSKILSSQILNAVKNLKIGNFSEPIKKADSITFLKLINKRNFSNIDKTKIEEIKNSIIDKQTNDILGMYSNNHLSKKRNSTLIEIR